MVMPSLKTGHDAARRRFWLAMSGFVMALALLPFSYKVERRLETAVHIKGGESEKVDRELAQRFQSPYAHRLVLVISGIPDPDSAQGADALGFLTSSLRSVPGVSGAVSSLDWPDPLFTGNNGGALIIVGLDPHNEAVEALVPKLRARADWMEGQLRSQYPKIKLEITGETPLNFDLRKVSADDVRHAEERAMPVTLLLLLLAFGSLVAALLPLGVGVLSISMAMGAAAILAHYLQLSILVQNLATMLGLGLGIDYALLMVSRFREALAEGYDPGPAADIAAGQAGRTLIISATTVAIGFSALLTVPISELRSIGIAGLLVTVLSVMLCTCILPWVLGLLGHRIDAAGVRRSARRFKTRDGLCAASERWVRWGTIITRRPRTALLIAGIPLLILAFQARKISPGVPDRHSLPGAAESVQALHTLQAMGRSGIVQSLRVILQLPLQSPPLSPAGWLAVSRLTKRFESDPRAQEVLSLPTLTGMADTADAVDQVPEPIRKSFLRSDGQATLIELLPTATLSPNEQIRWVREVRATDVAAITGMPGAVLQVGGVPALEADYDSVVKERLPKVVLGVDVGEFAGAPGWVTFFICGCQSNFAQSALGWRFIRCLSCRFSGRPREQTLWARRTDRHRISDRADSLVCHCLRIEHGLRGLPGGPSPRRTAARSVREGSSNRGPGADGGAYHERCGNHDCRLRRIHRGKLSGRPNAGLYARHRRVHRRNSGADGCRPGTIATCRRLELVALWLIQGPGNI